LNTAGKAFKFALRETVQFTERIEFKLPNNLYCGIPYLEIKLRDRLKTLTASEIKKIEDDIARQLNDPTIPVDENGNKLLELDIDGESVPALVGTEEGLSKIDDVVVQGAGKFLDDIVLPMKADFPKLKFNKIGDDAFEILDGAGKKWGTVYKDKIVCPARTQIGTAGNPILNKAVLVKNMRYEVDGIIYQSDELGRVLTTTADLDDIARVRLGNQQIRAVDVKDGVRGVDQGGHIVGSRFFGPGEQINLYPQSANLNQGPWKTMENSWADAMVAGKDVKIEVKAIFEGPSKRPMKFEVEHWIDGKYKLEKFDNL